MNPPDHGTATRAAADRPLLTFALLAFNQEAFIAEAVRDALAQTWSPLEIILSDDCSGDRTFEIMQELVAAHQGPHRVKLNRNPRNLGIGAHVNRAMELAEGELIVMAAGDDLSEPQRVATLARRWLEAGRPAGLCSRASVIDGDGVMVDALYDGYDTQFPEPDETRATSLRAYASDGSRNVLGCTAAYRRDVFAWFGPLADDVINEDNSMACRCWLLDRILFVNEPLVRYRKHEASLYHTTTGRLLTTRAEFAAGEARATRRAHWERAYLDQHLADIDKMKSKAADTDLPLDEVAGLIRTRRARAALVAAWPELSPRQRLARLWRQRAALPRPFLRARLARTCMPCYTTVRALIRRTLDTWRRLRPGSTPHARPNRSPR